MHFHLSFAEGKMLDANVCLQMNFLLSPVWTMWTFKLGVFSTLILFVVIKAFFITISFEANITFMPCSCEKYNTRITIIN